MRESILSNLIQKKLSRHSIIDRSFRINQILDYIYRQKVLDFTRMKNLPGYLIDFLNENFSILHIALLRREISRDGTVKFLFKLSGEKCIESVLLRDKNDRYTFCISSQSGCRMNCSFCATGRMGLHKNLDYTEIISQILFLAAHIEKSYNIVFMGMGEPLDNYDNIVSTLAEIRDNKFLKFSLSRITLSTCGITDKIIPLLESFPQINLAVSINSFIQSKRIKIMPVSKKYPVGDLINTLYQYYEKTKKRFTLEFVLNKGFNTDEDEINEFSRLRKDAFLINIIPDNSGKIDEKTITVFCSRLKRMGLNVTRRYRRGGDISADCGQLYWENKDKSL